MIYDPKPDKLVEFFLHLLENQRPLGKDFEDVWNNNLEELYEYDKPNEPDS